MSRGLSPNLRTMFKASLVERFAIRLLRMGFFAAGRLACVPFVGFAARRSSAARRAAGLARRGVVTSLRFAGSRGADSWAAIPVRLSDADSCAANCWGGKPWSTNSGGLDFRGAGSFAMNSCGTEPWAAGYGFLGYRLWAPDSAPWRCAGFPSKAARAALSGSDGAATVPRSRPRVLRSKAGHVVARQFRSNMQPGWCLQDGSRVGNLCANDERPLDGGEKQGRHADADNASECNQGGGGCETQMRVQGHLLRKGRPPRHADPGQEHRRYGGTMSVRGAGSQWKPKLCLTHKNLENIAE